MASKSVSVKGNATKKLAEDSKARKKAGGNKLNPATLDAFVNYAQNMGVGADNSMSSASYGLNPITRIRILLEWIYRGNWMGGLIVDLPADDMTQMGVEVQTEITPDDLQKIDSEATRLEIWPKLCESIKWGRLYGGTIAVLLIDGQDYSTPLRMQTVGKGQFKGLAIFDRWMAQPSLNNLVTEEGPDLGLPKFYAITADAPALRNKKIHHTRVFRFLGTEMPYNQRLQEQLWGTSVYERIYDRLVAFDSATMGAAQLIYKAFIRTYKIKNLREVIAAGGKAQQGLESFVQQMRRYQGNEGITLIDGNDEMEAMQSPTFTGLTDSLIHFGQQLSGAEQIPLVRLFGQSPVGLNSTGESDLRTYYDGIKKKQERYLKTPVTQIYTLLAQTLGINVPEGLGIQFRSLWQMYEKEKAEIANTVVDAVSKAEESGLITQQGAMKELKQSSRLTGIFSNITDEEIEGAAEELPPAGAEAVEMQQQLAKATAAGGSESGNGEKGEEEEPKTDTKAEDNART